MGAACWQSSCQGDGLIFGHSSQYKTDLPTRHICPVVQLQSCSTSFGDPDKKCQASSTVVSSHSWILQVLIHRVAMPSRETFRPGAETQVSLHCMISLPPESPGTFSRLSLSKDFMPVAPHGNSCKLISTQRSYSKPYYFTVCSPSGP